MALEITIKGIDNTDEKRCARRLADIYRRDLPDISGKLVIIPNATLFGQATKDVDIMVFGSFNKFSFDVHTPTWRNGETHPSAMHRVYVNNFCHCIEVKTHAAKDVTVDGQTLCVKYKDRLSDATTQSERQKYAAVDFFKERLNITPYIFNYIWLVNVDERLLDQLMPPAPTGRRLHNVLPSSFNARNIFVQACAQHLPLAGQTYTSLNSVGKNTPLDVDNFEKALSLFTERRNLLSQPTKMRLRTITSELDLSDSDYGQQLGKKLIVVRGRAGTGKTVKLLRIAFQYAKDQSARCLILTYNLALVSDIKRILAFEGVPDGVDSQTVQILSLHKFFFELMLGFGIQLDKPSGDKSDGNLKSRRYVDEYIPRYEEYLKELADYLRQGAISDIDIQNLMLSRHDEVNWDLVFVDEAQDWNPLEKEILLRLFGHKRIIVADGMDQMVRSGEHCNWRASLASNDYYEKRPEQMSRRQSSNLVRFINTYARRFAVDWNLEPSDKKLGGNVIVLPRKYDFEIFREQMAACREAKADAFDMPFFVPPNLVRKVGNESSFSECDLFQREGFALWDGTAKDVRSEYPTETNQHRLLQYDSCRGLEGWCVVCVALDEFVQYKAALWNARGRILAPPPGDELALRSPEQLKAQFVYLWSIIPLTRAIDTLVITLANPTGEFAKQLRICCEEHSDFASWLD